jgi:hypothetical protein
VAASLGIGLFAVVACGSAPAAPVGRPRVLPAADAAVWRALQPETWSVTLPIPTSVSVAGDGSGVAGAGQAADGGGPAVWAFTASGKSQALPGAQGGAVYALPRGAVLVGPGVADPPGTVTLFTGQGAVWSAGAIGPVAAAADLAGTHVAILDSGSATLSELRLTSDGGAQTLAVSGLRPLGPSASVQFDDLGEALVADAGQATLLGPSGAALWSVSLQNGGLPHSFVLDRDGGGVTAASSGADNTLYQVTAVAGGRLDVAWSAPLASGGPNQVVAGPGGRVAVRGVGGTATVAVYRTQDGALLWQDTLDAPAGGGVLPSVDAVAFGPGGGLVMVVSGCDAGGGACLLLVDGQGQPLGKVALPSGGRVTLAASGRAAVDVVPSADGSRATLTWLDLSSLWAAASGGVLSSS